MPISNFGDVLQKVLSFLPGTYATSLLRNHTLRGVFEELEKIGIPDEAIKGLRDSVDCNIYFFENSVPEWSMFLILGGTVALLIAAYVLINKISKKKN